MVNVKDAKKITTLYYKYTTRKNGTKAIVMNFPI